jgi:pyruvate formate lyase activating enzyme
LVNIEIGKAIMPITIYSAKGCLRCKIVKQFLNDKGRTYQDYDALGEGRKFFRTFYQNNREKIYRGPEGIEFPIFNENGLVRQGLLMVLAHLIAGPALNGFFKQGLLHGPWVDGIHISGGDPTQGEKLLDVLTLLKKQLLKLQIDANGVNAPLLEQVLERDLADRVIMEVKGPLELYNSLLQQPVDPEEIKRSIARVSQCNDYYFYTTIAPIIRGKGDLGQPSYITPREIAAAALLIKEAAGDSRQPYRLRAFNPATADDPRLQGYEVLAKNELFKYRTMARKHQFKTELI